MREIVEYFERGALERDLNTRLTSLRERNGNYDQYTDGFDEAVDRVENFPAAADVAPVAHARWGTGRFNLETGNYEEQCTRCRNFSKEYGKPYCPNCGAKMDGGDSDEVD